MATEKHDTLKDKLSGHIEGDLTIRCRSVGEDRAVLEIVFENEHVRLNLADPMRRLPETPDHPDCFVMEEDTSLVIEEVKLPVKLEGS